MKTDNINPLTLPTDLELVIGRTFEDYGNKKQFDELETLFELLIGLGYHFNIIRELKQVKVIPFNKFTYQPRVHERQKQRTGISNKDSLELLNKLKIQAVNEGNFELAAAVRDKENRLLSIDGKTSKTVINDIIASNHYLLSPKVLKTHVTIENCMVHIFLITRQDWFADKVQSLTIDKKKGQFAWLKLLVGKK